MQKKINRGCIVRSIDVTKLLGPSPQSSNRLSSPLVYPLTKYLQIEAKFSLRANKQSDPT